MSNLWITLLITLGASAWIFSQLQNRNGRNTKQSLTAAAIAALVIFILLLSIIGLIHG